MSGCKNIMVKMMETEGVRGETETSKVVEIMNDESRVKNCKYLGSVHTEVKPGILKSPSANDVHRNLRIKAAELNGNVVVLIGDVASHGNGKLSAEGKVYKCK
jgi:hypothetical protein